MPDRFYHPPPLDIGPVRLDGPEGHHLAHVLRAKPGLMVTLFDGCGVEAAARVERVERGAVLLSVSDRSVTEPAAAVSLTLGVALPKGERQRWLVEKATELGVARLTPLITARGVAQPAASAIARLRRTGIEACKQCGRNRLLEIGEPRDWQAFIVEGAAGDTLRLIAHPGGTRLSAAIPADAKPREITIAIGPEGGFTDEEIAAASASGWQRISLGPNLLRTETASIAAAAVVCLSSPSA